MKYRILHFLPFIALLWVVFAAPANPQPDDSGNTEELSAKITLVKAVMCEDLNDLVPQNPTTVFSIERRKAICFTTFDPVPEKTVIYHHWYHRDQSSARIRLTLKPPRWSTYSSIQFRAEDIGPWRVEVKDSQGNIFHVLRFSITD
jgi:hypothetical protein